MTSQEDRAVNVFVTDLRQRAEYCEFGALKGSLIRDQIVVAINDPTPWNEPLTWEGKLCRKKGAIQGTVEIFDTPTGQKSRASQS